ncbi:MAG: hypothetical protein ABMA64_35000 [Myxococcota bacterium]
MRAAWFAGLFGVAAGCVHPAAPAPTLTFTFEARPTTGEVRVLPALQLYAAVAPDLNSPLGRPLPHDQATTRITRAIQLDALAGAVGLALPGEVNGELGERWPGQFRLGSYPMGARGRVEEALRTGRDLDGVLGEAARAVGGDAVLISWVDQLDARPLSRDEWPGSLVNTAAGLIVVDPADEPFAVSARVGLALIASDGEVVVRYDDTYETVLSRERGTEVAARDLAHALASEVAKVWAVDPRLGEPRVARSSGTGGVASAEAPAARPAPASGFHAAR